MISREDIDAFSEDLKREEDLKRIRAYPSDLLAAVLMERGVIRRYAQNRFVPGAAIRQSQLAEDKIVEMERGSAAFELFQKLVQDKTVFVEHGHPGPDYAPSDLRVTAEILVVKPDI